MSTQDTFILRLDFFPQVKMLNLEQRSQLLTAIFAYSAGEELPAIDGYYPDVFRLHQNVAGSHFAKVVEPGRGYKLGQFKIIPFELYHDVPCVGYHIYHPEMGNLIFVTDTCVMRYRFDNLNHILIEANYDDGILDDNIRNGSMPGVIRPRLLKSHLELDSVKAILRAQDLSDVHNVVLLHLSSNNSNARQFAAEITATVGLPVHVASKGMTIELRA